MLLELSAGVLLLYFSADSLCQSQSMHAVSLKPDFMNRVVGVESQHMWEMYASVIMMPKNEPTSVVACCILKL